MSRNSTDAEFQGPPTLARLFPDGHGEVLVSGGPRALPLLTCLRGLGHQGDVQSDLFDPVNGVFSNGRRVSFRHTLPVGPEQYVYDVELCPEGDQDQVDYVTSVLGIFRDVTAEVNAGEGAYQMRQRLELMLSHVPGFCYTVDREGASTTASISSKAVSPRRPGAQSESGARCRPLRRGVWVERQATA